MYWCMPNHDGKGTYFIDGTWLSTGDAPEDREYDLRDMESLGLQPDYEGIERVKRWKERLDVD